MSIVWTLKWQPFAGGPPTTASLASFGIENPQVTFRSLDDDDFTFEVKGSATSGFAFSFGDGITLLKNGTAHFVGTISKRTVVGSGRTEYFKYVASGPWFQLRRTLWQPPQQFYGAASCALFSAGSTKAVLFQDPATGNAITTGVQIANVITYAESLGMAILPGTLPGFVNVPTEETRDLLLSDVIRRAAQWTPDAVSWFGYSSGVPIFNLQQRSFLPTVTINLASENLVSSFTLTPRDDLVPTGVLFNYVGTALCNVEVPNGCVDPSNGVLNSTGGPVLSNGPVQVQTLTQDSIGTPNTPGGVVGSIDLAQLTATATEGVPVGLAAAYFSSLETTYWDGEITTHEQECSGTIYVGAVLNLSGGQAAWATMAAQVQTVTEILYTGETRATFGTPQHLGPQNFAWLINQTRRRPLVTSGLAAVATPGTSGNGLNCSAGIDSQTKKALNKIAANGGAVASAIGQTNLGANLDTGSIAVCENGVQTMLKIYVPPQ